MSDKNDNIEVEEQPKYRKSKQSNVSKASKKSKHKHEYYDVLLRVRCGLQDEKGSLHFGRRCRVCGKLDWNGGLEFHTKESRDGHTYFSVWTDEEILAKYGHLEQYDYII